LEQGREKRVGLKGRDKEKKPRDKLGNRDLEGEIKGEVNIPSSSSRHLLNSLVKSPKILTKP